MFELDYSQPGNMAEFHSVYRQAVAAGRSTIIEVSTDRAANYAGHQLLWEKLTTAMAKKLKL